MKNLKLFYKQTIKYSFLFTIIVFFVSSVFICHIYTVEAVSSDHNHSQDDQTSSKNSHHSSGPCHGEKESLVNQSEPQLLLVSNKVQNQNNQKFTPDSNFITSEGLSNSIQQRDGPHISSENLNDSQTAQLLTIIKIE